jgi:hypothetical protein
MIRFFAALKSGRIMNNDPSVMYAECLSLVDVMLPTTMVFHSSLITISKPNVKGLVRTISSVTLKTFPNMVVLPTPERPMMRTRNFGHWATMLFVGGTISFAVSTSIFVQSLNSFARPSPEREFPAFGEEFGMLFLDCRSGMMNDKIRWGGGQPFKDTVRPLLRLDFHIVPSITSVTS